MQQIDSLRQLDSPRQSVLQRYSRQQILPGIGEEGQRKLGQSHVLILGCGALGCLTASALIRAGVGRLRLVDRGVVALHNLQRQILYDEADARMGLAKAVAAESSLKEVNHQVRVEGIVANFSSGNALALVEGVDLALDGLDNYESRFLLNDVAWKTGIPWIYGAAVGTVGLTATFLPHQTPCFRCLHPELPPPDTILDCTVAGVINAVPWMVAAIQAAEAVKLLVGDPSLNKGLLLVDPWNHNYEKIALATRANCLTCRGRYSFLDGPL